MKSKIGFMQGRLSPLKEKKIQAFPWNNWENEFRIGKSLNFKILEWTLDFIKLYSNPLMTKEGQKKIKSLCAKYNFKVLSLTGDCFMQKPFWKINASKRPSLQMDFLNIVYASGKIGIKFIVLPLVDNGKLKNQKQEEILINFVKKIYPTLRSNKIKILFESDFEPKKYLKFIKKFDYEFVGINYDTGNSASYGFDPDEEISLYGKYIDNVHIKDRFYKGNTVPLGEGNVDFQTVFEKLKQIKYKGNYILQAARSKNKQQVCIIKEYKDFVTKFLKHL